VSRFRIRQDVVVLQPAPGTILPGVPLVGRDVGPLIPQQRVHDPLSAADRSDVVLSQALPVDVTPHSVDDDVSELAPVGHHAPAIDGALLEAVVRRMPPPIHPSSASMAGPPAPERVKLMVGVLARDFKRFDIPTVPSVRSTSAHEPAGQTHWGPWPEPHTSAWPVVVPPWGQIPRSFARPLPELVTHSA